ncbi:hypothetical protein LAZ40_01160 [Cereibacter sphaeroides]|uniref:hypothetical protein n=1 Tax=Cereibacter sphaeroides TaxID=1063 RepID=UPI001F22B998|nr:hypothetical protein [Cereibacter sphaeroides]MCE6957675.1 hypothetical protein [Cereibacter sphaeroides]MCE6971405.1 hypothetical protein [Cereibacter sphaeroides]
MTFRLTLFSVLATFGLAASCAAASAPALDDLLAGVETCTPTPRHETFRSALADIVPVRTGHYEAPGDAGILGKIARRGGMPEAPEALDVLVEDGAIYFTLEMRGTFHGLPVRSVHVYHGIDRGGYGWWVDFAVPREEVIRVFGRTVTKAVRSFGPDDVALLEIPRGKARISCDLST